MSKTDRYGRLVAPVILPDGRDLSVELVKAGLAWHYKKYSDDEELARLEVEARKASRGLWSEPEPVPPWEWRKVEGGEGEMDLEENGYLRCRPVKLSEGRLLRCACSLRGSLLYPLRDR